MKPLWDAGMLAPVHAVGSPSSTRSHFDAQDYMETGTPDQKGTPDGWLNRYLATQGTCEAGLRANEAAQRTLAVPRRGDDAADAAHPRGSGADDRDELARRVHVRAERQRRPIGSRRSTARAPPTSCTRRAARCSRR